jgi:hypothetical protein
MNSKAILAALALAATSLAPVAARADVVEHITMTFQSGATFDGNVTFLDDFSQFTAVNGWMSGGGYGTDMFYNFKSSQDYSEGSHNFSNFLLDNRPSSQDNFTYFILLAVDYSDPGQLVFTSGESINGRDNSINWFDPMISGTISLVPEAGTWAMLMLGLAGIGFASRSTRARTQALAA